MSEGPGVIIAMPDLPGFPMVPDCVERKCAFCARILHLSPGGQALIAEGAFPVCPVCMMVNAPPGKEAKVHPVIRKEVEDRTGVSPEKIMEGIKADEAIAMLAEKIITIEGQIERGEISG